MIICAPVECARRISAQTVECIFRERVCVCMHAHARGRTLVKGVVVKAGTRK